MSRKKYAVRIIVTETGKVNVTFGDEATRRMKGDNDDVYVTVRRMDAEDGARLLFSVWENKTSNDMIRLAEGNKLQYSRKTDVELFKEFEGEYDGLRQLKASVFYVRVADVRAWSVVLPSRKQDMPAERTEKPVERTDDTQANVSPLDALKALASDFRRKAESADGDRREAEKLRDEAIARVAMFESKALAIEEAIKIMEEGQDGEAH